MDTFCPSPFTTHFSVGAGIYSPRMVIGSDLCGLFIQLLPQGKNALASPTKPASDAGALPGLGTQRHPLKEPPRAWITPLNPGAPCWCTAMGAEAHCSPDKHQQNGTITLMLLFFFFKYSLLENKMKSVTMDLVLGLTACVPIYTPLIIMYGLGKRYFEKHLENSFYIAIYTLFIPCRNGRSI